jgi:hypothetical protein
VSDPSDDSFDGMVDDPAALAAAEDAAAAEGRRPKARRGAGAQHIDEHWEIVATQIAPGQDSGLDDVVRALESDGIDCGWDPYDPRDIVNFMPPSAGLTARKLFSVVVPASQAARAHDTLYGEPPQGVSYPWARFSASGQGVGASAPPVAGLAGRAVPPRPTSKDGISLSDNARFARMADGSPSIAMMIGAVFAIVGLVIAMGVAALVMLKG